MTPDEATDLVRSSMPLCDMLAMRAEGAGPDEVRLEIDHAPGLCTTGGVLHGGVLMTLADSAGATCAYLNLPDGAVGTTTLESKTNFLGAVRSGTATAVATPLHVGGSTIVIETWSPTTAAAPSPRSPRRRWCCGPRPARSVSFRRMQISLEGKVALVTGASRGIGRAIATAFAGAGADGDAVVAQAGRARGGGRRDRRGRRRDGGVRRQRRRARPDRRLRRRHGRAVRAGRHPGEQRRHQPLHGPGHRHRPAPLRQDLAGQLPGPGRVGPGGVAGLDGSSTAARSSTSRRSAGCRSRRASGTTT